MGRRDQQDDASRRRHDGIRRSCEEDWDMERAKPVATPAADLGSLIRAAAEREPWIGQAIKARYQVSRRLAAGPSGLCTALTTRSRERK